MTPWLDGTDSAGPVRYMADRTPLLTPDEERRLVSRSAAGDRLAEARLVLSHLRMVVKLAQRYGRQYGLPMADLMQEGTIGLIQAVRKFNPDRDNRLSTYAAWWIRAAIQDYVVRSWSLVRVGKSAAHRALFFTLRRGDAADLAAPPGEDRLSGLVDRFRLPAAEILALARRLSAPDTPLDAPLPAPGGGDTPLSLADRLPAEEPSPEEQAAERGWQARCGHMLDRALSMLPAREAQIIRKRHLLDPAPTFESIGRELGISKDRVRQLEQRALARLRDILHPMATQGGL